MPDKIDTHPAVEPTEPRCEPEQQTAGNTLAVLGSAALLIPGISAPVQADAPPESTSIAYRYSFYEEDDLPGTNVAPLSTTERYQIDVHQFKLVTPVADDYSLTADVQYETMSGASPWQTQKDSQGVPRLIMSGASISDTRTDLSVAVARHQSHGKWAVRLQHSDEDDYSSWALGIDREWDTRDKLRSYALGLSYSDDSIEPTQGIYPTHTLKDDKDIWSLYAGVSQVIDASSMFRVSVSFTRLDGFLTDPYKFNDRRPEQRDQWALSLGYRKFLDQLDAAVHADYRFFDDDWGVNSHTLSAQWYQNFGPHWQLVPSVRYYSQSEASFFGNEALEHVGDEFFADDFRLSTYGAVSVGLKVNYSVSNWLLTAAWEDYSSDGSRAITSVDEESPALLEFSRYTVGFSYRW